MQQVSLNIQTNVYGWEDGRLNLEAKVVVSTFVQWEANLRQNKATSVSIMDGQFGWRTTTVEIFKFVSIRPTAGMKEKVCDCRNR